MLIRNCLTERKHLKLVYPDDTIQEVLTKMDGHLSLPCVEADGRFVGIVSKRTIFETFQGAVDSGQSYEEFIIQSVRPCIDPTVSTLTLNDHFERTVDIIIRHPFVAIVEAGILLGIVKRGDVNQVLSVAFANNMESQRLLLGTAEVEGALQRLFTITHRLEINVITAIPFDAGTQALNRRVLLKVSKTDRFDQLVYQIEKAGFLVVEATQKAGS